MRSKKLLLKSMIILLAFSFKSSKKDNYNNSILWEINNPVSNNTSYVLGTIHVLDTTKINFPVAKFKKLIDNSKNLCLELFTENTDGISLLNEYLFLTEEDSRISNSLDKDYYNKLLKIVNSSNGILRNYKPYLDSIRPTILSFFIEAEKQFSNPEDFKSFNYSPESDFQKYALEKKYEIISLETPEQQVKWLVKPTQSFDKSLEDLKKAIDSFNDENSSVDIYKKYAEQNLKLKKPEDSNDSITIVRNKLMASKIDSITRSKSIFIAVGAGHLPSKNGILNLLSEKGFSIRPIKINLKKE